MLRSTSDWWFAGAVLAALLLASWWPRMSGQLNADAVREQVAARLQQDAALSNPDLVVYTLSRSRDETRVASRLLHRASTLVFARRDGAWTWIGIVVDRDPQLSVEAYLARVRDDNEAAAVGAIRAINTAEVALRIRSGHYGTLETLQAERLLVLDLQSSPPRGYELVLDADAVSFRISARPIAYARSGVRSFYGDESLIVRGADHRGDEATASDPEWESKALLLEQRAPVHEDGNRLGQVVAFDRGDEEALTVGRNRPLTRVHVEASQRDAE